ncbi:MAG: DUF4238 domain-containing protein [Neisseria sp.]|uniref:DUF4238 domain-containing protein n=1 Tax=Neisseria sp. TaxID=192066 RepID=UPI0026DB34E8|nr:DUF4238 domain-containing protein [Neisseria sp.]MDO4247409.1 DUF4238 domain-containing protein [Neisseria sp.]
MAGKRQHYIPQFLQRGFAIEGDKKKAFVIRAGKAAYLSNIQDIGVEGYFYTEGEDVLVDDLITEEENLIAPIINDFRTCLNGEVLPSESAAKIVAHFEIRTRHLRMNYLQGIKNMVQQISRIFFEDEKNFFTYLRNQIINDNNFIAEQINSYGMIPNHQKKMWIEIIKRNPDLIIQNLPKDLLIDMAKRLRQEFSDDYLIKKIKEGHIKALKQTIAPDEKIAIFSKLSFKIVEIKDKLFLGDSIVVFVNSEGRWRPFYEKGDKLKSIVIPLSKNKYLFGTIDKTDRTYPSEQLRKMLASCSLEFLISPEKELGEKYSTQIGSHADILSQDRASQLLKEILEE